MNPFLPAAIYCDAGHRSGRAFFNSFLLESGYLSVIHKPHNHEKLTFSDGKPFLIDLQNIP
jgi:hypothetical protein